MTKLKVLWVVARHGLPMLWTVVKDVHTLRHDLATADPKTMVVIGLFDIALTEIVQRYPTTKPLFAKATDILADAIKAHVA